MSDTEENIIENNNNTEDSNNHQENDELDNTNNNNNTTTTTTSEEDKDQDNSNSNNDNNEENSNNDNNGENKELENNTTTAEEKENNNNNNNDTTPETTDNEKPTSNNSNEEKTPETLNENNEEEKEEEKEEKGQKENSEKNSSEQNENQKSEEQQDNQNKDLGLKSEKLRTKAQNEYKNMLPRMFDYVDKYARTKAQATAIIEYNTGDEVSWADFQKATVAFAAKLLSLGFQKGDVICTSLPMLKEHLYLMYACMRLGVIISPLDLRLKDHEIARCLRLVRPKAYFFLGKTPKVDFRPMIETLMKEFHPNHQENNGNNENDNNNNNNENHVVQHWIQFQKESDMIIPGAVGITEFASDVKRQFIFNKMKELFGYGVQALSSAIDKRDPTFIIFTTGSTGNPKPAMLCHENILMQNIGLNVAFFNDDEAVVRMLVNLPPSHVGCTTEQLATTIYAGGVSVLLHVFDAKETLDAVQKYKVNCLGQIPALFNMLWRLPDYDEYDLSSLNFCLYGGQAVSRQFLEKLLSMSPGSGSGLGLTETAGFVTYTPLDGTVDDILASIGFDSPLCPISIREPMNEDGTVGKELEKGETGEICFEGPQLFLGYFKDEENTRKVISKEGILYTGDLGSYDETGLHFASRRKFMIKPKGYQVYPPEVEDYIQSQFENKIAQIGAVGVSHEIFSEGIVLVIELNEGVELTADEIIQSSKGMAAYKRPSHVVFVGSEEFPLNRVAKTDYMELKKIAEKEVEELRANGKWDKE